MSEKTPPVPLWVLVVGGVMLAAVVVVVVLHLTGNGMAGMH
ncbi:MULTISPECIES: hypothetical protein [Microbacterium]|nr:MULTISPECIES: hypothetical protein [Microbacterium]